MRAASVERNTKETRISASVGLDGTGEREEPGDDHRIVRGLHVEPRGVQGREPLAKRHVRSLPKWTHDATAVRSDERDVWRVHRTAVLGESQ